MDVDQINPSLKITTNLSNTGLSYNRTAINPLCIRRLTLRDYTLRYKVRSLGGIKIIAINISNMFKPFLRKLKLPNVVKFSLTDAVMNPIAYFHGLIKRDRQLVVESKIKNLCRANRYLERSFIRMYKLVLKGQTEKFDKVAQIILRKSDAFLILCFNRVNPSWTSMHLIKVHKLIKSVHKLRSNLATDIDYKRVWIDKKPGDFGRPLGVPKMDWRIYLLMVTLIGECFAYGKGYYSPNQHGGRAGYGVMSCLKDLAQRLPTAKYLYEFDLKGFFDHVSHDYISNLFKGTFLKPLYNQMMKAKPQKYELPPLEKDVAYTKFQEVASSIKTFTYKGGKTIDIDMDWGVRNMPVEDFGFQIVSDEEYEFLMTDPDMTVEYASTLVPQSEVDEWDRIEASVKGALELSKDYKKLMIPSSENTYTKKIGENASREVIPATESARAIGRDSWKDLDLPNQGVPQGSAFGPFLSSIAVAHSLYKVKNLIMYIDDGMLFYQRKVTKFPKEFVDGLSRIGVEIHPEKCKITPVSELNTKFLGMRFTLKNQVRKFFTIASETRAGTKRPLIQNPLDRESMLEYLREMLVRGEITVSKYKYARWAVMKSRLSNYIPENTIEMSIKYGFFGLLISWLYSPTLDLDDMKERINTGMLAAWQRITLGQGSLGQAFAKMQSTPYIDQDNNLNEAAVDLYNMSTIATSFLLEKMHKGSLSRGFIYSGLVNKSKENRKIITTYAGTTATSAIHKAYKPSWRSSTFASSVPRTDRVRAAAKAMERLGEYYTT